MENIASELNELIDIINLWSKDYGYVTKYSIASIDELDIELHKVNTYYKSRQSAEDPISGSWIVGHNSPVGYDELFKYLYDNNISFIIENIDGRKRLITIYKFLSNLLACYAQVGFTKKYNGDKNMGDLLTKFMDWIKGICPNYEPKEVIDTKKKVVKKSKILATTKAKPKTVKPLVKKEIKKITKTKIQK